VAERKKIWCVLRREGARTLVKRKKGKGGWVTRETERKNWGKKNTLRLWGTDGSGGGEKSESQEIEDRGGYSGKSHSRHVPEGSLEHKKRGELDPEEPTKGPMVQGQKPSFKTNKGKSPPQNSGEKIRGGKNALKLKAHGETIVKIQGG